MFSLEWLGGMFFVWFRKQLKAAAVWSLKLAWFFYRAHPAKRLMMALAFHTCFLQIAVRLREAGLLHRFLFHPVRLYADWSTPRLQAWREQVRTTTTA